MAKKQPTAAQAPQGKLPSKDTPADPAPEADLFALDATFPDAEAVFGYTPRSLDAIKDSALVVLDTNALLLPYRTDPASLKAIETTYQTLIKAGRLVIPAQVAREFALHRPNLLRELYQQIAKRYVALEGTAHYPLMGALDEYKDLKAIESELLEKVEAQRKAVSKLLERVRNWHWDDPVSSLYRTLFKAVVVTPKQDKKAVTAEFERRKANKIPPGYKDAGAGDLLIWLTVLEIAAAKKQDAIFVSGDEKADWWHRSSDGALYPRYELVDEYRRHSGGRSFHIVRLGRLLELMGADAEIVEAVRQQEAVAIRPTRQPGHWGHIAEVAVYNWLGARGAVTTSADGELEFMQPGGAPRRLEVKLLADPRIAVTKFTASLERTASTGISRLVVMVAASRRRAEICLSELQKWINHAEHEFSLESQVLVGYVSRGRFVPLEFVWPHAGPWIMRLS